MKTVTINLMDIVNGTTTNADAVPLFIVLDREIQSGNKIRLSLECVTPFSSSFLNSSFGELVDKHGFTKIKKSVSLINYKKSDAIRIKNYLFDLASI